MSTGAPANRNDPCPCGSGKKYKKCCLGKPGGGRKGAAPAGGAAPGRPAPPSAAAMLGQATDLHRRGRFDEAANLYRQVLEQRPRSAPALVGLGQIQSQIGNQTAAIELLRRAIAVEPRRADFHVTLAAVLHLDGQAEEALRFARRAVTLDPSSAAAHGLVASCYERRNRYDEAMTAAKKALSLAPHDANAAILLAGLHRRRGDHEKSRDQLRAIIGRPGLDAVLRQEALNQLGLTLERLGDYDAAYDAFTRAGAETARDPIARRTDEALWHRRIRDYRRGLTPELLARWKRDEPIDDHPTPAFLVGFSRSGTTLTEQVMAAHPSIVTSNEKPIIRNVKQELSRMSGGGEDIPRMLDALDVRGISALRACFWEQARHFAEEDLEGRIFVHKQPMNIIDIGLINVLFPDARVIVALRDPRDVCLSCFQQLFVINTMNVNFLSLEQTVRFYADVMALWLHVRPMLTLRWIDVKYEDTVTDLETQARRILELLDLPWNADVLSFQERAKDRYIATPSYAAVTGPVTTAAVGRWHRYEKQFEPLLPVLAPYVEAFGYGGGAERRSDGATEGSGGAG